MNARATWAGAAALLGAAVVWGLAFVPQKLTVAELSPLQAVAIRFALAAPLALALANRRLKAPGVSVRAAVVLGALLFLAYALQTAALVTAPVARVALVTGTYAVFVPLFAPWFGHVRPTVQHWVGAGLALGGLAALVGVGGAALAVPLGAGDVYVLLHAVVGAFHVLLVGRLAKTADPFALNAMQLTVLMLFSVGALVFVGVPSLDVVDERTWAAFAYLAAMSTVLAFTLQIVGQRSTSPPTAAVIMLLETPIGVVAALWVLEERLRFSQWIGAGTLLAGVAVSLAAEARRGSQ